MDQTTGDMRPSDPYFDQIPDTDAASAYAGSEDDLRAGDHVTYAELTERDASGVTDDVTGDETSDEIREDIEQTRSNMGETIDAIQARLSPERLTQQAKDAVYDATIGKVGQTMNDVTDTARESGYTLLDTLRQNPLPAALAGIGVGWLVMKVRENGQRRSAYRYGGYQQRYAPGYGGHSTGGYSAQYGGRYGDERVTYHGATSSGGSNGPSLTDRAQDTMGQVSDKVTGTAQQVGGQIQDQAQQVASQAQYQAYRAKGWFERTMDENPLAIGLVAVAAGALAGMAVPETDQERQWMGPARDQLMDKAQDIAQDTAQKAQRVAQEATNAATNAAKSEAKNQNLVQ